VVVHVPSPQFPEGRAGRQGVDSSRESPYGLEATGYGDWGRPFLCGTDNSVIREVDSDRAAAYVVNVVNAVIIKVMERRLVA